MKNDEQDVSKRELGMGQPITRRDFLNGIAIGAGSVLASGWLSGFDLDAMTQFA